jgi:hypothetical protein
MKVIIDFDGTLTAEETQAGLQAEKSLDTLAKEILEVPRERLAADYAATQIRMLRAPHCYWWEVGGLIASYCDEGAFILNTTTLQVMLRENASYLRMVKASFPKIEYDPVVDCTNVLFHRHTAELAPAFRPAAYEVLVSLLEHPDRTPVVLTNSLGDKVRASLATIGLDEEITVLGDTRQYEMAPHWTHRFVHPRLGQIQIWPISERYSVDLRRPDYYRALVKAAVDDTLVVVADTFSMPGALPLMMSIPFFLVRAPYTPVWCIQAVETHPLGCVLDDLAELPAALDAVMPGPRDDVASACGKQFSVGNR